MNIHDGKCKICGYGCCNCNWCLGKKEGEKDICKVCYGLKKGVESARTVKEQDKASS